MLGEMALDHVPVLAPELLELLDPRPGELAVDGTFGAGGHARLVAERLGPEGELIAIDRDPAAAARFAAFADEVDCRTRFLAAPFADALEALAAEGVRADVAYLDLGMSSMQVDEPGRGFSYAHAAPLDMRMDPTQEPSAADAVNHWEERRLARVLRDFGEERYADRIARAIARERGRRPSRRRTGSSTSSRTRSRARPASPAATRPSARSRPCGSRSTTSSASSTARSRPPGSSCAERPICRDLLPFPGRPAREAVPRRPARRGASARPTSRCAPAAARPRPSADPQAVTASPEEVADNPRAKSARLRAARKLGRSDRHDPAPVARRHGDRRPPAHRRRAARAAARLRPRAPPAARRPRRAAVRRGARAALEPLVRGAARRRAGSTACCAGAPGSRSWPAR